MSLLLNPLIVVLGAGSLEEAAVSGPAVTLLQFTQVCLAAETWNSSS